MNSSNAWKRFLKRKVSVVAGIVAILIVIIALIGPMFCTQDPYKQDLLNINKGPSAEHILGTDYLGRDTFTRIIYGARVSLGVAFAGVLLGSCVGVLLGICAGFFGGWFDSAVNALVTVLQAFPGMLLAIALNPRLIVCDEPVSALDVSIQAQILNLLQDLQKKYSLTYIFISHNLSVVKHLCDRIMVMYLGNVVELASSDQLFDNTQHPYSEALLAAIPVPDPDHPRPAEGLEGDVPSPINPPSGCCFRTRCPHADERCAKEKPVLKDIGNGHMVACHKR